MTVHFKSAGRTDTGKVRRRNEDSILVRDEAGLWVVADGLG
ncbi:MAG TPA: serine/threonine-protein phosphatase, partial [Rhodanobacteraceae bacterium]|nr:serine/threonine-protein phosphatase [Rhodanobacteraceae bacterium]